MVLTLIGNVVFAIFHVSFLMAYDKMKLVVPKMELELSKIVDPTQEC